MSNHRGSAGAAARRSLFSASDRGRLLEQALGRPTGVVVEIGGVEFDLVPLAFADGRVVIELADKIGTTFARGGEAGTEEIATLVAHEGERIWTLARKVLHDSAFLEDAEQLALFDEWFVRLPMVATLKALIPAVLRANAPNLGNAPRPAAEASTPTSETESPSDSSTSSATS